MRAALLVCLLLLAPLAHAPASSMPAQAADLLALARAPHADPLRDAIRIAERAAPGPAVALPRHASPVGAVQALLASRGMAADLAGLDALPPRTAAALARVVDAFLALDAASSLGARAALLDAMLGLRDALAVEAVPPLHLQLPPAFDLDLAGTSDTYTQDVALLIDAGGDDTYLNNAGGSNVLGSSACVIPPVFGHAAAVLDLAGNDRYVSGRRCGVNGGGWIGGSGLLVDAAGDDTYAAWDNAVNGGGLLGTGLLLDAAGNDTYLAGGVGTNGGGLERGAGMLVDMGGDDAYLAGPAATNGGGSTGGSGFLLDAAGDDTYRATHIGVNGGGWLGGTGLLLDAAGDDSYAACCLGANGAGAEPGGLPGAGLLVDGGGRDAYSDEQGGTGTDVTVAPKGIAGAQFDLSG